MTVIALRDEHAALAIRPGQEMFTEKQRAALTVLGIKDASNADLAVFMHYCQKTGLDPFSRQVYMIGRREKDRDGNWVVKQTIQTGIDGFRVIRDRVAAQLGASVEYEDTIWYDDGGGEHKVWLWDEPPAACRVVVVKNGRRFPAVVRTASYIAMKDGKPVSQWRTQADHMIEKCAEAYALRRAFPHDLGGLYIEDEMPPPAAIQAQSERVTAADIIGTPHTPAAQAPASPEAEPPPAQPATTIPAGKHALDKLSDLERQVLGTWPDDEIRETYERITGSEWTASKSQVLLVTSLLDDALKTAKGDAEAASASLWKQFHGDGNG